MPPIKPVKHHAAVKQLLSKEVLAIDGGLEKLQEIADFYNKKLVKEGFNFYLALKVVSEAPTKAMKASGKKHRVIVLGVISGTVRLLSTPSSIEARNELFAKCSQQENHD